MKYFIASDIHNTETILNASEFNTLKFLFKIDDPNLKNNKNSNTIINNKANLSQYCSIFDNLPPISKVSMNVVNDFLQNNISNNFQEDPDYIILRKLSKCLTIKNTNEVGNKNLKITQCEDSNI